MGYVSTIILSFVANVFLYFCIILLPFQIYIDMLTKLADIKLATHKWGEKETDFCLHLPLQLNTIPIVLLKNLSFGYLLCQRSLLAKLDLGTKARDK